MKLSCVVVDDEPLAIDQMVEFISKVPFLEHKASFKKGLDALMYMKENHVDILFLDIQMDDINGIQLLKSLKEYPAIILTTAFSQYAIEGYSLDVSDYLLKPIAFDRFVKAVDKVYSKSVNNKRDENLKSVRSSTEDFIFVKSEGKLIKIKFDEILFIEGQRDYLKFHLTNKRRIMTLLSFKAVEDQLPIESFIRVHKSYIIAAGKIEFIAKNTLRIADAEIPIGENYKDSINIFLGNRKIMK